LAVRPHSRTRSEKATALGDASCASIVRTHAAKSVGTIAGGIGSRSHDVRRAHTCSMSSMAGGTTRPCRPRSIKGDAGAGTVAGTGAGVVGVCPSAMSGAMNAAKPTADAIRRKKRR
jgi:hypothetical protein